jgi:hypothetical protein
MKKFLAMVLLVTICIMITYLFWQNELRYSIPTPVPTNYKNIARGSFIDIHGKIATQSGKPSFIHFFNPACPCSRFNLKHFKELVNKYHQQINFSIVVIDKNNAYTPQSINEKFDLAVPISFDTSIAGICGVYSTPQAVLLDSMQHLYFRGNYNKNRYCTTQNSNYAQIAIDSLLNGNHKISFSALALKAYGCEITTCNIK